jgi:hypothetical protein
MDKPQKSWEAGAFDREKGEWVHTTLHSYDHTEDVERVFISQSAPTTIRPTKRIKPERDAEVEFFFGDTHHPAHDQRKLDLAMLAILEYQPDRITFIGDDLDNALFSRFESQQEWAGQTQAGIDSFVETISQVKANAPNASIVVHEGNHNVRLEKQIRNYNGELLGLRRGGMHKELGVLTLGYLLRAEELGFEYVTGYPESEYWHSDTLKSYHGRRTSSSGLVAVKEIKEETVNFVHGHTHQAGIVYRTFKDGRSQKTIFGMEVGTFADMNKVPSGKYSQTEQGNVLRQTHDWQTVLGMVVRSGDVEVPSLIPITNEGIIIKDKLYKS